MGKEVKPGQRVRFLHLAGKPGVFAWDLPQRPDPRSIDTARYTTLLLRAVAEVVGPFLAGYTVADWLGEATRNTCRYRSAPGWR